MEAWFLHAADDGSLVLARCRRWKLDHQVLLLDTMVAVTRGILPGHRAPTVAVGIASSITKCCWIPWWPSLVGSTQALERPRWPVASSSITKCCCCWIPRWPSASRARSPSAAGYHGGRHSWDPPRPSSSHGGRWHRELDHQVLLLDTPVAVTRARLNGLGSPFGLSTNRPQWEQY